METSFILIHGETVCVGQPLSVCFKCIVSEGLEWTPSALLIRVYI